MTTREAITINTYDDREKVARWARGVSAGTIVEFRKSTRSHEQNAKMHAMLGEVAAQVTWYGQKLKVEDWKNMFTASLRKSQVVPGIDPGTVVPLGIHTSSMTIDEMSNMIELIYAFGSQPEHSVTFKEPQQKNPSEGASPSPSDTGEPSGLPDEAGASTAPSLPDAPASNDDCADLLARYANEILGAAGSGASGKDIASIKTKWVKEFDGFPADVLENVEHITAEARRVFNGTTKLSEAFENVAGLIGVDAEKIGGRS